LFIVLAAVQYRQAMDYCAGLLTS